VTFRFWGVRGSLPCPPTPESIRAKISAVVQRLQPSDLAGPLSRERFLAGLPPELFGLTGGNSTCFELQSDPGQIVAVDAGTGLRELGLFHEARDDRPKHYHIFLSHLHWDHIQGLPFFPGLAEARNRVTFYSPLSGFEERLRAQMREPYFPVPFSVFPARTEFVELADEPLTVAGTRICWQPVPHPGTCAGYRFDRDGRSLVFSTDTELGRDDFGGGTEIRRFFGGADVLVMDAQYTLAELLDRRNWGHSSASLAVEFALQHGARTLYLFHHEPDHDDARLEEMVRTSQWYADRLQPGRLEVRLAREGRWETAA